MNVQVAIPTLLSAAGLLLLFIERSELGDVRQSLAARIHALPDKSKISQRLELVGKKGGYPGFRFNQISHSAIAAAVAFACVFLLLGQLVPAGILSLVSGALLFFLEDRKLSHDVRRYRQQIESEFAPIIEMMTLALSAGESPLGAIFRISNRSDSKLAGEFRHVIAAVKQGSPLHVALDAMGRKIDSVIIRRFVDACITAIVRGAPLVDVLQRHAIEARQSQRNIVMDRAGKAEISMMVPVVFLILPISVLFALWPSLNHLNLFT